MWVQTARLKPCPSQNHLRDSFQAACGISAKETLFQRLRYTLASESRETSQRKTGSWPKAFQNLATPKSPLIVFRMQHNSKIFCRLLSLRSDARLSLGLMMRD